MSELRELPVHLTGGVIELGLVSELPAAGSNGEMYFVLETKALYYWDSTTWKQLATV